MRFQVIPPLVSQQRRIQAKRLATLIAEEGARRPVGAAMLGGDVIVEFELASKRL